MTHEQSSGNQGNQLPHHYELPSNQMMAELDIVADFENRFPESAALMHAAVAELHAHNDTGPSRWENAEDGHRAEEAAPVLDHMGTSPQYDVALTLGMPSNSKRDPAEYRRLSPMDKLKAATEDGMSAVDPVETDSPTGAFLDGLYSLTGASVDYEGPGLTKDTRLVVRKGEFDGKAIYFAEEHEIAEREGSELPLVSVRMMSADRGPKYINALTGDQRRELSDVIGGPAALGRVIAQHSIDRHNVDGFIELAAAVNEAGAGAVDEAVVETTEGVIDMPESFGQSSDGSFDAEAGYTIRLLGDTLIKAGPELATQQLESQLDELHDLKDGDPRKRALTTLLIAAHGAGASQAAEHRLKAFDILDNTELLSDDEREVFGEVMKKVADFDGMGETPQTTEEYFTAAMHNYRNQRPELPDEATNGEMAFYAYLAGSALSDKAVAGRYQDMLDRMVVSRTKKNDA